MSAPKPRWADAGTAAAWFELRELAPQLAALVHCPVLDRQLHVALDWGRPGRASRCPAGARPRPPTGGAAGDDDLLSGRAHTYAIGPAPVGRGEAIELFDPDGCGRVIGRVLPLLSMIAMSLHGAEGDRLVKAVHADLVRTLERLWAVGR